MPYWMLRSLYMSLQISWIKIVKIGWVFPFDWLIGRFVFYTAFAVFYIKIAITYVPYDNYFEKNRSILYGYRWTSVRNHKAARQLYIQCNAADQLCDFFTFVAKFARIQPHSWQGKLASILRNLSWHSGWARQWNVNSVIRRSYDSHARFAFTVPVRVLPVAAGRTWTEISWVEYRTYAPLLPMTNQ